jgi:hypothetical protein
MFISGIFIFMIFYCRFSHAKLYHLLCSFPLPHSAQGMIEKNSISFAFLFVDILKRTGDGETKKFISHTLRFSHIYRKEATKKPKRGGGVGWEGQIVESTAFSHIQYTWRWLFMWIYGYDNNTLLFYCVLFFVGANFLLRFFGSREFWEFDKEKWNSCF